MSYTLPGGTESDFITFGPSVLVTAGSLHLVIQPSVAGYTPPNGQAVDFNRELEYILPLGLAANFTCAAAPTSTATGTGAGVIPITASGVGSSVKPSTTGTGAGTIPITASGVGASYPRRLGAIRSGATGEWVKASPQVADVFAPHPVTKPENINSENIWETPQKTDANGASPWVLTAKADGSTQLPFDAYGNLMRFDSAVLWSRAIVADTKRRLLWLAFGEMLNEDTGSGWVESLPADHMRKSAWAGNTVISRFIVPYIRPTALSADFNVKGGGVDFWQTSDQTYTPPTSNIVFNLNNSTYTPQIIDYPEFNITDPECSAVDFLYNPAYFTKTDAFGYPVVELAYRDAGSVGVWGKQRQADNDRKHPWVKYSRTLSPGWGIPTEGGGNPVPQPGETITIPIQRVYIVLNEIQLLRVSNTTPIETLTMNISFDCDSWLPQFTATIPEAARAAIMPDPSPVEVEAIINGVQFRFFVERIQRNRQFGQNTISIAGRGIACELDAPYAVASQWTNGVQMTAQQIIGDTLTNTGYSQTWNITDWLVPANTFSQYGTPAQIAASVADASGSVLQADWLLRDLRMMPRYPVKPWDWATATPEYVIPGAVTQTESVEWVEKPSYNVVYVSGVQNGVLGQVKITGTAGDLAAPMYTNPLITHNDAARQKGISILSDTGRKTMLQLTMPVLPATGVIDVCRLIEFNDGSTARRGIVRANNISVNWPTVRQTLTIEAAA